MDMGLAELWNTRMIVVFVTFIRVVYRRRIYMSLSERENRQLWGLVKTPTEHYLDDLCPVLHFSARIFRNQGLM